MRRFLGVVLATTALAAACRGTGPATSVDVHEQTFGGLARRWYSYRAVGMAPGPAPVLILLHGFHEAPTHLPAVTGVAAAAGRDGFEVVAPEGIALSWDAGSCCGPAEVHGVDDVGFLTALVAELVQSGDADPSRIYVAGFSNGAMMAFAFACARPDLLAGVMVVEGALTASCPGGRAPTNLLVTHQTGDPVVRLEGTRSPSAVLSARGPFPSVLDGLARWSAASGCGSPDGFRPPAVAGTVARMQLSCPLGRVAELVVLAGGTHDWPHRKPLDATAELLRFFGLAPG